MPMTALDSQFLDEGLRIIFEDIDSGEAFDDLEKSSDSIFNTLDKSDKDIPFNIKLVVPPEEDEEKIKLNVNPYDNSQTEKPDIKLKVDPWRPLPTTQIPNKDTIDFGMKDNNTDNIEKFKIKINNDIPSETEEKINLKVDDKDSTQNIKLKVSDNNKSSTTKNIKLIMTDTSNLENFSLDDNEELKKLLKSNNPNELLIHCLNVLRDGKQAIDRLVSLVPDDSILVKTQNLTMELLNKINNEHELLLKDKNKCNELAINVSKFIMDLKQYLKVKFSELKDDVDEAQNKDDNLDDKLDDVKEDVKKETKIDIKK